MAQVDLKTIPISPDGGNVDAGPSEDSGKPITVFHDPENFNVKHPLSNRWTLWFTKPASGKVRKCQLHPASSLDMSANTNKTVFFFT